MAPSDEAERMHMVATACQIDDRPSAIRYPRGEALGIEMPPRGTPLAIGKGRVVRAGSKVAILPLGTRLEHYLAAPAHLAALGLSTPAAAARFAKPLDADLLRRPPRQPRALAPGEEADLGGCSA